MEDYIRLLSQQQSLSGGTSLTTMYIPPNGKVISLSKQTLTNTNEVAVKEIWNHLKQ